MTGEILFPARLTVMFICFVEKIALRSMSVISRHDSTTERKLSRMHSLQRTISGTSQLDVSVLCI